MVQEVVGEDEHEEILDVYAVVVDIVLIVLCAIKILLEVEVRDD